MSVKAITITLKSDGREIASQELVKGCEPVTIGRSHACTLRTPPEDKSVSSSHARLFWKGGTLYIEDDNSRNGIVFNGKKIQKTAKVESGGIYALVNCLLIAASAAKSRKSAAGRRHRLEYLNGDKVNQMVEIKPRSGGSEGEFVIGMDPSSDLSLRDMLVSRRHAVISCKTNGECWISDPGSTNGTYVNGEQLTGKERLLKDGDKISIAYFDFRFHHRDGRPPSQPVMVKVCVLTVLGILIASGRAVYKIGPGPKSEDYRRLAEAAAAKEDFNLALESVE